MRQIVEKIYALINRNVDKVLHAAVAFTLVITYAFIAGADHFYFGVIGALVISVLKEVLDEITYGGADIWDLLADGIGIAAATVICVFKIIF